MNILKSLFGNYSKRELKRIKPIVDNVLSLESKYSKMDDSELQRQTEILKKRLKNGESLDDILADAFAVCREAAYRVLSMKHFPVQLIGGIVLHQGRIAEMKTGEGKTLVATLPAYLHALSGEGVHIVTVNDYLAKRDSEWMGKVYRFLGLTVGLITHDMDNSQRKEAYLADITYATNNELGFDYLRDNMVTYKEDKVQRGHAFAVVDEVDSILIDEARTPLIISGKGDKSTELYTLANNFAKKLDVVKVTELNDKEDNDENYEDADYIVDEKAKTATLTKAGIKKAEKFFNVENLTDADNISLQHHINQAIKAQGVMKRDIDYVVKDGEVIIVDEFTGRLMYGRRYNEGLHQAIEAKEGVKVAHESKTLATITFQNYFRLYKRLSGMTGTALTEETEFREIYKLDVVEIPTNKEMIRQDLPDLVFRNEKGKFECLIEDIANCNENGQPVLVGTISIEKSELLSKMLKKRGIKHEVLNAKHHEKEARIISQAGKAGAVTIATNMAGRGTDIVLGGNCEFMAKEKMRKMKIAEELIDECTSFAETDNEDILTARETYKKLYEEFEEEVKTEAQKVREAGGLYIMGTERHESRRIDNQLRGRAGRQGDPGKSRFYLSAEDDLLRLFGGDRMKNIMDRLNVEEDVPIENKMLSNTIEGAQRKVEGRNFGIRKSVLQYDDVMNQQRKMIYQQRNKVLNDESVKENIISMIKGSIEESVKLYLPEDVVKDEWNLKGLCDYYRDWLIDEKELEFSTDELEKIEASDIKEKLISKAIDIYKQREEEFTEELMRELERVVLLKNVDTKWMDHIDAMEELKQGIRLRAYGQRDPVVEYRFEGSNMYDEMINAIREDTARMILTMKIKKNESLKREQVAKPTTAGRASEDGLSQERKPIVKAKKIGRNAPCPCGSGRKYKQCCGK